MNQDHPVTGNYGPMTEAEFSKEMQELDKQGKDLDDFYNGLPNPITDKSKKERYINDLINLITNNSEIRDLILDMANEAERRENETDSGKN